MSADVTEYIRIKALTTKDFDFAKWLHNCGLVGEVIKISMMIFINR